MYRKRKSEAGEQGFFFILLFHPIMFPYSIIFTARERTKGKGSGQGNNKTCQFHSGMSPSKKELILKTGPFHLYVEFVFLNSLGPRTILRCNASDQYPV